MGSLISILASKRRKTGQNHRRVEVEAAVDYLLQNNVWLIIDNHETKDDGRLEAS